MWMKHWGCGIGEESLLEGARLDSKRPCLSLPTSTSCSRPCLLKDFQTLWNCGFISRLDSNLHQLLFFLFFFLSVEVFVLLWFCISLTASASRMYQITSPLCQLVHASVRPLHASLGQATDFKKCFLQVWPFLMLWDVWDGWFQMYNWALFILGWRISAVKLSPFYRGLAFLCFFVLSLRSFNSLLAWHT